MYIKISRLCMLMLASAFIGMSIVFYVEHVTTGLSSTLPAICILCMLVLIAFLLIVQHTNNKAEQKKAALNNDSLTKTTTNKEE